MNHHLPGFLHEGKVWTQRATWGSSTQGNELVKKQLEASQGRRLRRYQPALVFKGQINLDLELPAPEPKRIISVV